MYTLYKFNYFTNFMEFKLDFKLEDLVDFLFRARNHGYAGGAEKVKNPQRPGFKEFPPYREGDFEYVDSYAGHYYAPGQEIIRFKGIPVWNMAYNGGMLPRFHGDTDFSKKVYGFLKKVLQTVDHKKPFRGPDKFLDLENKFKYLNKSEGNITNFKGTEMILYYDLPDAYNEVVFSQDYIGGLIIHK